jgi:hypothetical protein
MEEIWQADGTARTTEMDGSQDGLARRNGACCGFSSEFVSARLPYLLSGRLPTPKVNRL